MVIYLKFKNSPGNDYSYNTDDANNYDGKYFDERNIE